MASYEPHWDSDNECIRCGDPRCEEVLHFEAFKNYQCFFCGSRVDKRRLQEVAGSFLSPAAKRWLIICKRLGINPGHTSSGRYFFGDSDSQRRLERAFPGCTVVWDHHPVTKKWPSFYMKAISHWTEEYPVLRAFKLDRNGSLEILRSEDSICRPVRADYCEKEEHWVVFR